jgi:hypothetical protein
MELVIEVSGAAATARAYGLLLGPCVPTVPAIRMHARTHACMHRTACTHAPHACTHRTRTHQRRRRLLQYELVRCCVHACDAM